MGNYNPPGATKEFWAPVTYGTEIASVVYYPAALINGVDDVAHIAFSVPHDFSSIIEAVVVRIARATANHRLNYETAYAAQGEVYSTHTEALLDQDTDETNVYIYEQDISSILSSLAAGDYVGIFVKGDIVNTPSDSILGARFRYS